MTCQSNVECQTHGICRNNTCQCRSKYTGPNCSQCASEDYVQTQGYCLQKCEKTCPAKFTCQEDINLKINICQCEDENADPDTNCQRCQYNFRKTNKGCQREKCVKNKQLCSGVGSCSFDGDDFSCVCDENYTGKYCQECATGWPKIDGKCVFGENLASFDCSGAGKYDFAAKKCVCEVGYAGVQCQDCSDGFKRYNDVSGMICVSKDCFDADSIYPCSNKGICVNKNGKYQCECQKDTIGEFCENCENGYKLIDGSCLNENCIGNSVECAYNGSCVENDGEFACECELGFDESTNCMNCKTGSTLISGECLDDRCVINGQECSKNGYCRPNYEENSYKCSCDKGYIGQFCEQCDAEKGFISVEFDKCVKPECISGNTQCNNNGICKEGVQAWACKCRIGFSGLLCDKSEAGCLEGFELVGGVCAEKNNRIAGNVSCVVIPIIVGFVLVCAIWFWVKQKKVNSFKKIENSPEIAYLIQN